MSPPLGMDKKEVTQWAEILSESTFFIYWHLQFHELRNQKLFYHIMGSTLHSMAEQAGKVYKKTCSGTRYFSLGGTYFYLYS